MNEQISIFLDKRENGYRQPDGTVINYNPNDYYIDIMLIKNNRLVDDYVHIYQDKTKYIIQRQEINPFFIEYGLFSNLPLNNKGIIKIDDGIITMATGNTTTYITINS